MWFKLIKATFALAWALLAMVGKVAGVVLSSTADAATTLDGGVRRTVDGTLEPWTVDEHGNDVGMHTGTLISD